MEMVWTAAFGGCGWTLVLPAAACCCAAAALLQPVRTTCARHRGSKQLRRTHHGAAAEDGVRRRRRQRRAAVVRARRALDGPAPLGVLNQARHLRARAQGGFCDGRAGRCARRRRPAPGGACHAACTPIASPRPWRVVRHWTRARERLQRRERAHARARDAQRHTHQSLGVWKRQPLQEQLIELELGARVHGVAIKAAAAGRSRACACKGGRAGVARISRGAHRGSSAARPAPRT